MKISFKKYFHRLALPNELPKSSAHRKAELLKPFPNKNRTIQLFFYRHRSDIPAQKRLNS
jgi:hypothetical protein